MSLALVYNEIFDEPPARSPPPVSAAADHALWASLTDGDDVMAQARAELEAKQQKQQDDPLTWLRGLEGLSDAVKEEKLHDKIAALTRTSESLAQNVTRLEAELAATRSELDVRKSLDEEIASLKAQLQTRRASEQEASAARDLAVDHLNTLFELVRPWRPT